MLTKEQIVSVLATLWNNYNTSISQAKQILDTTAINAEIHWSLLDNLNLTINLIKKNRNEVFGLSELYDSISSQLNLSDIKDLRDMRQHQDEYLVGTGKHQDRYIKNAQDALHDVDIPTNISIGADAGSIIYVDGYPLIGGRVRVDKVYNVLSQERHKLIQIYHKHK